MPSPHSPQRRRLVGLLAASCLPAVHASSPRIFTIQTEPSLAHGKALIEAALRAAGFAASLVEAPRTTEQRNLHEMEAGRIHITLLPPTVPRLSMVYEGRIRLIPVPLERGLLGWRSPFLLQTERDMTAGVKVRADLQSLIIGQGANWIDADIYRRAGITTREIQAWRNGEFADQMQSGVIDLFPMGLEESISYFVPHFQEHRPELALDEHLLLRYPWYRFVWVTAHPDADDLYHALQEGFDSIVSTGEFESIWSQYRHIPAAEHLHGRTLIELENPLYTRDIVPKRYQRLLLDPAGL